VDIALLAVGGILVGGTWSLWRQDAPVWLVTLVGVAAVLILVAAWAVP